MATTQHTFLPIAYVRWHYKKGPYELINFFKNILWFIPNFFSFKTLSNNLFAPWYNMSERYDGGIFSPSLFLNFVMRLFGFVSRIFVIVFGLSIYTITLILAILSFVLWFFAPILVFGLLIVAISVVAV